MSINSKYQIYLMQQNNDLFKLTMTLGNKDMLKHIKPNDVCVEVGVWKGDLSRQIAQTQASEIYLVDPWQSINDVPGRLA